MHCISRFTSAPIELWCLALNFEVLLLLAILNEAGVLS